MIILLNAEDDMDEIVDDLFLDQKSRCNLS